MGILLSALEYGVSTADMDVAQASLEAVAALAKSHLEAVHSGAPGLKSSGGLAQALCVLPIFSLAVLSHLKEWLEGWKCSRFGRKCLELCLQAPFFWQASWSSSSVGCCWRTWGWEPLR